MAEYDRFASMLRNIIKRGRGGADSELIESLQKAFHSCVSWLPETLVYDLFYFFTQPAGSVPGVDEIRLAGEKLQELLYLFEMDYERVNETFSDDEWTFIRESVSECAADLDQTLLTYIMKKIVAKGLLG